MITREFIRRNRHILFVFGDNDTRTGFGGMAKDFRGEVNAIGIRTKKYPGMDKSHFYTDDELSANQSKITNDIKNVLNSSINYSYIYLPSLIGLGKANMATRCPKTHTFLRQEMLRIEVILKNSGKKVVWF
jgi:hypothetical protein